MKRKNNMKHIVNMKKKMYNKYAERGCFNGYAES